ncbi:hypothetical protein [Halovenus marina]|uniref:hypothetical protein n=1 Tax=Halovenus marina TaxID=3396621 RepID=UPI003F545CCB
MVEDRITDGERIAQLLASELTGLDVEPLEGVTVVDADRDVSPSSDGPVAYRIRHRESYVGAVRLYPDGARLQLTVTDDTVLESVDERHRELTVIEGRSGDIGGEFHSTSAIDRESYSDDVLTVQIASGAAVKPALDVVRDVLEQT